MHIERETEGTIKVYENGWIRLFNSGGDEIADVHPTGQDWCMIEEQAKRQIRMRVMAK